MNKFYLNGSKSKDEKGLLSYPVIDTMIKDNLWFVPILPKEQDRAYYSSSEEKIVVPLKRQFKDGESFYATLFHEMAHSTGHKSRLDRLKPAIFGSYDYGGKNLLLNYRRYCFKFFGDLFYNSGRKCCLSQILASDNKRKARFLILCSW